MLKINNNNQAVSEVLGSILLIVISVSLFSTVYAVLFTTDVQNSTPAVDIVGTIDDNKLILEHRGGESLLTKTEVILTFSNGGKKIFSVNDENYVNNNSKEDGKWDIGERVVFPLFNLENFSRFDILDITVVDKKSNEPNYRKYSLVNISKYFYYVIIEY